jgi:hypothetical protein
MTWTGAALGQARRTAAPPEWRHPGAANDHLVALGRVMALLGEARGRDDQHGSIAVMKDGMGDAAEHQRLHAPEAARTQDDAARCTPAAAVSPATCASADPS